VWHVFSSATTLVELLKIEWKESDEGVNPIKQKLP